MNYRSLHKKHLFFPFFWACLLLLSACQSASAPTPSPLPAPSGLAGGGQPAVRALCSMQSLDGVTNTEIARGVQDGLDLLGVEVTMHDSRNDATQQYAAIAEFLAGGGQVIVCQAVDPAGIAVHLQEANDKGVPVVLLGEGYENANASLSWNETEAAGTLAAFCRDWMAQTRTRGDVVVLEYARHSVHSFSAGAEEVFPPSGGVEVIRERIAQGQSAAESAAHILQRHAGARVFIAADDALAMAVHDSLFGSAAQNAGGGDAAAYCIVSLGGGPAAIRLLEEGGAYRAAALLSPYQQGLRLADMAALAAGGGSAQETVTPVLTTASAAGNDPA